MTLSTLVKNRERGFLDGQFLIAMPGMDDENFARTVIYVCAHTSEGAMGFIINRSQPLSFTDILDHLDMLGGEEEIRLPETARRFPILNGGPVDKGRGFVLHSDDYTSASSIPVSDDISLTATLDIIRAISGGRGPRKATIMLGYSGWGPGQLEREISANGWLTCPVTERSERLIFDPALETKYDQALALMGINPAMLSREAGHA
ncbi:MAG: YqgE/AlgH family protein [Proteobacteria bacterium]|nr:YqgE/AlgH family protein [Pseudomonadota bacterium]